MTTDYNIHRGLLQRDALRIARDFGCKVEFRHRTGEIAVTHPLFNRQYTINSRRKDTPRILVNALRYLAERVRMQERAAPAPADVIHVPVGNNGHLPEPLPIVHPAPAPPIDLPEPCKVASVKRPINAIPFPRAMPKLHLSKEAVANLYMRIDQVLVAHPEGITLRDLIILAEIPKMNFQYLGKIIGTFPTYRYRTKFQGPIIVSYNPPPEGIRVAAGYKKRTREERIEGEPPQRHLPQPLPEVPAPAPTPLPTPPPQPEVLAALPMPGTLRRALVDLAAVQADFWTKFREALIESDKMRLKPR